MKLSINCTQNILRILTVIDDLIPSTDSKGGGSGRMSGNDRPPNRPPETAHNSFTAHRAAPRARAEAGARAVGRRRAEDVPPPPAAPAYPPWHAVMQRGYAPTYAEAAAFCDYQAARFRDLVAGAGVDRAWMPSALPAPTGFGGHNHIMASAGAAAPYSAIHSAAFGAPSSATYLPYAAARAVPQLRGLPTTAAVEATPNHLPRAAAQRWHGAVDAAPGSTPLPRVEAQAAARQKPEQSRPLIKRSSKFRGVSWQMSARKWKAQIRVGGQNHYLGMFSDEVRAAQVYDDAIRTHFPPGVKKPRKWAGFNMPRDGEERSFRRGASADDGAAATSVLVPRAAAAAAPVPDVAARGAATAAPRAGTEAAAMASAVPVPSTATSTAVFNLSPRRAKRARLDTGTAIAGTGGGVSAMLESTDHLSGFVHFAAAHSRRRSVPAHETSLRVQWAALSGAERLAWEAASVALADGAELTTV